MSNFKIPAFDLLQGEGGIYQGFGEPLVGGGQVLFDEIESTLGRLHRGFGIDSSKLPSIPREIDQIIDNMRLDGWAPEQRSLNLFVRDFGLSLSASIVDSFQGIYVLRSPKDISHLSIYWKDSSVEAFPFHRVLRCLLKPESPSLYSFFNSLGMRLANINTLH